MQLKKEKLELLAPAKNIDIGIAAIECGADALYIGGPRYGARESAGNSLDDIQKLVNYAHPYGVSVYMVVNTLLFDSEIDNAVKTIQSAYEIGCDAVIVQDLGLLECGLPPIPLFASTQTNIRTVEQAIFLEQLGFKRLILARELSLNQIAEIRSNTNVELESFVHGALCVSYSGNCYMSSKLVGRSGNRGECAQLCRLNYNLIDSRGNIIVNNRPLLSLKDLNLSNYIEQLIDSGITSFKIEGRLKDAPYVSNVVRHYRDIIDRIIAKREGLQKSSYGTLYGGFSPKIDSTFNRGYTQLFIDNKRDKWSSGSVVKSTGERLGVITRVWKSASLTSFEYKSNEILNNGDGLFIIDNEGVAIGLRANIVRGNIVETDGIYSIKKDSILYRNYNHHFIKDILSNRPQLNIDIELSINIESDSMVVKSLFKGEIILTTIYAIPKDIANNRELALKSIKDQLSKRADIFKFTVKEIICNSVPFFPISILNSIRRQLASNLFTAFSSNRRDSSYICKEKIDFDNLNLKRVSTDADYRENIINSKAKNLYSKLGYKYIQDGIELTVGEDLIELMRCKYCIRYELGICKKSKEGTKVLDPLYLENRGRKFRLLFDCEICEMVVLG